MSVLFQDSGTGADESPLTTNFTTLPSLNGLRRVSNQFANITGSTASGAYVDSIVTPDDQYAQAEVAVVGSGDGGCMVRASATSNGMFITNHNATNIYAYSMVGGGYNEEANPLGVYQVGDEVYLGVEGTTYTIKKNGSTLTTFGDASFASGDAGMFIFNGAIRFINLEVGDFESGTSYPVSVAEAGSAADAVSAAMVAVGALSEAASSSDALSSMLTAVGSITEAGVAADSESGPIIAVGVLSETASGADTAAAMLTTVGVLSESVSAADIASAIATLVASLSETGSAADLVSGSLGSATYNVSVAETASASDAIAAALSAASEVIEAGNASDAHGALLSAVAAVIEVGSASDTAIAQIAALSSITEIAAAIDSLTTDPRISPRGSRIVLVSAQTRRVTVRPN